MKYVAAYLMAVLAGNDEPTVEEVKHILSAVDAEVDDEMLAKFFAQVQGKNVQEMIVTGLSKLGSVASSGARPAAAAGAVAGDEAAAAEEEAKPVEEEEEEEEMDFDLFD
ncbi:60S acidic ribosomal protein P2, putative [Perkinsus marinus ATCC 50983]|uniref:60S acidic ribosomal protein P2, putative n=1 Tax=Perkinsus marinus (strain ATCC 50983 / TXsc) TaxID=423536 RepID=C5KMM7_PERM5|nr:60S acidic ribosomal protein P2, putative [Perkinsus marinus ATCC 50983]EER14185.1 60S acidic ribosomal protein P2, putative [Perkinsus marinus ATCC 50983]|eukprot:XP_002782390.1 60S acidic ribosomal protein P2, putative [Perkinsus marinus ATCC 50983]